MIESERQENPEPTAEERRRAVCDAMAISPGLIRFASRFTRSLHDAEDAYQRAMEIALTRAPVTDRKRFLAWLRTVLKHEALAIAGERLREATGVEEDVADSPILAPGPGPEATVEWRTRYLAIQDAISRLTESQRICLMLQSAGASYDQIADLTGFSLRKIERSVIEGRNGLKAWEVSLEAGEVCLDLDPAIERSATGEAAGREANSVERHVKHCHGCRALLASRSRRAQTFAALVPAALVAQPLSTATPDPGPYLAAWDRAFGGLTVRAGQLVQLGIELPGTALGRAAAGAGALALALFTAAPIVSDYVGNDPAAAPEPAAVVETPPDTPSRVSEPPVAATPAPVEASLRASADPRREPGDITVPGSARKPASGSQEARSQPTVADSRHDLAGQGPSVAAAPQPAAAGGGGVPAVPTPAPPSAPAPTTAQLTNADVVIPHEAPQPGPDGAVIYGD